MESMKITVLRADEEFVQKYGEFIHKEISKRYLQIKDVVEFLARMKSQYGETSGALVTFYLDFPEVGSPLGFIMFKLDIEFDEKIMFSLYRNNEEPVILDIEGFSCWNGQDEEMMDERYEKYKAEHGGPDLLYP